MCLEVNARIFPKAWFYIQENSVIFKKFEIDNSMPEESIKVFTRVRPLTQKQSNKLAAQCLALDLKEKQITLKDPNSQRNNNKVFSFDNIFSHEVSQQTIYESTSKALTREVLQGYNGTIFAYGQTGSGKTYTMMGDLKEENEWGIIPRCFQEILLTAKADKSKDYLIMCSYVELYNEQLRDLLHLNDKIKLELRESPEKGIFIKELKKVPVTSSVQIFKYLKFGNQNRTTGETLMNSESSRSHSIFTIYAESMQKRSGQIQKLVGSKFNLVDLAGSQRQSKTGSIGQRFLQATKINLSLTALGKVISSLVEGKGGFIPYRDSKLTRILQDSLGGNSKTIMIATVSPACYNYEETLSTLKYASRAKYITNVPIINLDPKDALLKEYESQIRKLRNMLTDMQKEDQPALDTLIEENKRIKNEAEDEKKELIGKIKKLEEQLISTPYQLPQSYKKERTIRQQKLTFMEKNYKSLQEEVKQMKQQLVELRRKYKAASKEIFQMQNEHEKEREIIQEEFQEIQKQNVVLRSVLNVLFTEKQLKNIIGLGNWQGNQKFKLPTFYFKDRHTLAFPCEDESENQQQHLISNKTESRNHSMDKHHTTATSFGARVNGTYQGRTIARKR